MIIALDNIRSQYNVGSIFRTLDGAFGNKCALLLGGYTPTPQNKTICKTALGAENNVPWEKLEHLEKRLRELKKEEYTLISIEECTGSRSLKDHLDKFDDKSVIIFGAETTGISKNILEISDLILHIPMNGVKNSLNVASTVAIVSYLTNFSIPSNLSEPKPQ